MNVEPIISRDAERDLDRIASQRCKRGAFVARYIIAGIPEHIEKQAQFPDTGNPCDEYYPGLRRTVKFHYVIYFRRIADTILVVRVIHGSSNVDRIMKRYFRN